MGIRFDKLPNNAFRGVANDDPRDLIEVEVGDVHQPEFLPQVKISRFNNEHNVSIRLINHDEPAAAVSQRAGKVHWKGTKKTAAFYDILPSEEHPEGASEFEITLLEKPASNVVEFSLNTKGVSFFYQPALTQAEMDVGRFRPEHVIGSYAVYTDQTKVNIAGGKLYRSGKVGHIYRPKMIDANGNWTWGDLDIEPIGDTGAGILTVTIPQAFLDTAAYPVRHAAGLTFGYTSTPATEHQPAIFTFSGVGYFLSTDTPSAGTVTSIQVYARERFADPNLVAKMALWRASTGVLETNGASPEISITGSTASWRVSTYSSQPSITAIQYQLGVALNKVNGGPGPSIYYDSLSAGSGGIDSTDLNYATPGNITPSNITNDDRRYGIYATYTPAPSITESGSLSNFGNVAPGSNSSAQSFTVAGSGLTANLVVTAPSTDFQVSLSSGSGFGSSVSIAPSSGTVANTTIYVRFTPQSSGAKSGNVVVSSTGATSQNVAAAGTGISPQKFFFS